MIPLTHRQRQVKDFIRERTRTGAAPSQQEIADHLGIASKGSVCALLSRMEERGHIRRHSGFSRSIEVVDIEEHRAVLLSGEVFRLLNAYAAAERVTVDTAASELLRKSLGADA
jgi:SOS-response transcriptional repressor LexA